MLISSAQAKKLYSLDHTGNMLNDASTLQGNAGSGSHIYRLTL
jgi:hypothetical protein